MKHSTPELLLRIAQADAYAVAAEYCSRHPEEQEQQDLLNLTRYLTHPTYHKLPPGTYTDDTQMSIAVAETLLFDKLRQIGDPSVDWDDDLEPMTFAARFFIAFSRDKRDGYSRKFQAILEESTDPQDMLRRIVPNSDKNGAAMRSCPIGVLPFPHQVLEVAETQAKITHDTFGGIRSSQAVALMSHFALHEAGELSELPEYVAHYLPDLEFFKRPWEGVIDWKNVGIKTAHAACTLASSKKSLRDIMRQVIEWGGDTDSVAAVAWGIASPRMRDEKLPEFMERDLEPGGSYGPSFLLRLGSRLMTAFGG